MISENEFPDMVIACDQVQNRVVVYDMATYDGVDLDHNEVWSFRPDNSACKNISGVKYREDTIFGDVVLIVASGGYAGIVKYPSKEVVWEIPDCGSNPHSIEILPSGNVVTAGSGGTLRIYYTSRVLSGVSGNDVGKKTYTLESAHGVLWDPEYEVMWAVGETELVAYSPAGPDDAQTLSRLAGMGAPLPSESGHALSADLTDTAFLWVSANGGVYHFDKEANAFEKKYAYSTHLSSTYVKSVGNDRNGNFFRCVSAGGAGTPWENAAFQSWCTDTIHFCQVVDGVMKPVKCKSSACAFYKTYVFDGKYQ